MVDFHTHILFDIDDGAKSLEDSLQLLNLQANQGVKSVVLTPHFYPRLNVLKEYVMKRNEHMLILENAITKLDLDIKILKGSEVYFSNDLLDLDLRDLVIENTDYILIEFSSKMMTNTLISQLQGIISKGYIPILAHIERYPFFVDNSQLLVDLIEVGVLTQVNAKTFLDKQHHKWLKAAVKHNLVHLIASDTHSMDKRPPNLKKGLDEVESRFGSEFKEYLLTNARKMLDNEIIEVYQPSKINKVLGILL